MELSVCLLIRLTMSLALVLCWQDEHWMMYIIFSNLDITNPSTGRRLLADFSALLTGATPARPAPATTKLAESRWRRGFLIRGCGNNFPVRDAVGGVAGTSGETPVGTDLFMR